MEARLQEFSHDPVLEQGAPQFADSFERVFGVPLGVDPSGVCTAVGVPVTVATTAAELTSQLDDALGAGGVRVVVARSCVRQQEAELLTAVTSAVADAVGAA